MLETLTHRLRTAFIYATLPILALPSSAHAQVGTPIGSCPATCSSNCYLQNNFTCTNGQGVTLNSGANLDMNGHSISCVSARCDAAAAVTINGNGSKVYNALAGFEAVITGPFTTGVQCNNKTSSEVAGIAIKHIGDGTTGGVNGVVDCAKVHDNVFLAQGTASNGIAVSSLNGTANSDFVRDNYIDDWFGAIYVLARTKNMTVEHNLITLRNHAPSSTFGIVAVNSPGTSSTVESNVFMGDATSSSPIAVTGSGALTTTFDQNFCDPTLGTACSDCVSAGQCENPAAPFTMP